MNVLYFDLIGGASGDMILGALLDLGVNFLKVEGELARLGLDGYHLHARRATKSGIAGVKFDVHLGESDDAEDGVLPAAGAGHHHGEHGHAHSHPHSHGHGHDHPHDTPEAGPAHTHGSPGEARHDHGHGDDHSCAGDGIRTYAQIRDLIQRSPLSDWVKARAVAVFHRVAVAEAKIHGSAVDTVHFHEVGALDSIIDIVGCCIALELLGRPRVEASVVTEGRGWVRCAHGRFPVPTPATLEILGARGVPLTQCTEPNELVTPTGAALLAEFAESFGPMRNLVASKVGYGLGTRDLASRPNVLRAVLGPVQTDALPVDEAGDVGWETDRVMVIEANLDDVTPEILGHFVGVALGAGALDVFHTPVVMKKNRPGTLVTLLCHPGDEERLSRLLLTETGTFGVRRHEAQRRKLARSFVEAVTPYGPVRVKQGSLGGGVLHHSPEFESCREVAGRAGVPVKTVYEAAIRAVKTAG